MLRLIGQALLAQHRVSGRVAVEEKPDVLWDRPDLERLYARLEDEYELKERAGALKRKLDVIVETAHALTDIIDADRATRLEATIVVLIVLELIASMCSDCAGAAREVRGAGASSPLEGTWRLIIAAVRRACRALHRIVVMLLSRRNAQLDY